MARTASPEPPARADCGPAAPSPCDDEPPLRWLRRARLLPADSLGAGRRAAVLALLAWLPIALWAAATGRLADDSGESLLRHYGVHVRCLVVIPLLVLGEQMLHDTARRIAACLAATAGAEPASRVRFDAVGAGVLRLRDASLPWVLMIGAAIGWAIADRPQVHADALVWAMEGDGALGFGGWWFAYIARPILLALLLAWLWRIVLLCEWLRRIGRIDLPLVPTHPDRAGGIAIVSKLPGAFAPVSVALAAIVASRWAHEILHHGANLDAYKPTTAVLVVVWSAMLLLPLLALAPALARARARSLAAYSALVGRHGRLVHRRWIEGREVGDEAILDAPEIGPVADAAVLYDAVKQMRRVPIGKASIAMIIVPLAIPLVLVAALRIPVKELLLDLVKVLV